MIDATSELIPVFKPQIAFFEKYEALSALKETIKYAHKKDLLVILDAKRNDIGSTSEAYAYSIFKNYDADACTINAYLGIDGVKPFLDYNDKGLFVLVKTSNPSSKDFQDLFSTQLTDVPNDISEYRVQDQDLKRNYRTKPNFVNHWVMLHFHLPNIMMIMRGKNDPISFTQMCKVYEGMDFFDIAEEAEARRYAPADLARARDRLSEAQASAASTSDWIEARRAAEKAAVDAEVAAARAGAERLRISVQEVRRSVREAGAGEP